MRRRLGAATHHLTATDYVGQASRRYRKQPLSAFSAIPALPPFHCDLNVAKASLRGVC